jgi:hypothetical protein
MRRLRVGLLAVMAVLSLAGCERQKAARHPVPPPSKLAADAADVGLLAAAEPFEALTDAAFTTKLAELDPGIATAVATAEHVKPALPPDAQQELQTHLDAIAAARREGNRAGIALASVEVYRVLVSHAPADVVPREVNLLRYAGHRYAVDLKAAPATWDDAAEAAAFGQRTWAAIQGRVADASLRDRMSKALSDMAEAARRRDAALATDAYQRVLALADLVETDFATVRR